MLQATDKTTYPSRPLEQQMELIGENIVLVTDAWGKQVNGVQKTYQKLIKKLAEKGINVFVICPDDYLNAPCPGYNEIRLAMPFTLEKRLQKLQDQNLMGALHIATEGPLGHIAMRWAQKQQVPFSSCIHTRFDLYAKKWAQKGLKFVPFMQKETKEHLANWAQWAASTYIMQPFQQKSDNVMAPCPSIIKTYENCSPRALHEWARWVETVQFNPKPNAEKPDIYEQIHNRGKKVATYVGRVSAEKGLPDFLDMQPEGVEKVVVGGFASPAVEKELREKYPDVHFVGKKSGAELASFYANTDVFCTMSTTETFGNTTLEAIATGVPVVVIDAPGNTDIVSGGGQDIGRIIPNLPREDMLKLGAKYLTEMAYTPKTPRLIQKRVTYATTGKFAPEAVIEQFLTGLVPLSQPAKQPTPAFNPYTLQIN